MVNRSFIIGFFCVIVCLVSACTPLAAQAVAGAETNPGMLPNADATIDIINPTLVPEANLTWTVPETQPTANVAVMANGTTLSTPQPTATLARDDWQNWPVFPDSLSQRARDIYSAGIAAGNDPQRFSKIGDCQNINTFFLALYDDPTSYTLGETYQPLQETIDYYAGSWSRKCISVRGGFNVATIFNPWFSDKELCGENETPIDCELRVNQPSVVLISMEAWWKGDPARYEMHLRRIVDTVLAHQALPILATKADNLEGDYDINRAIVQIAYEYDLPLWNFWRAVQDIPRKGLEDDLFHLTHGINDFSNSKNLRQGWPVRNLTALQTLDAVRRLLEPQ